MRQGLQLKFSQQLNMTPQLQQAIKLLQLSTLDLEQEIIEQLYNNPLLETDEQAGANDQIQQDNNSGADDVSFDNDDPENYTQSQDSTEHVSGTSETTWETDNSDNLPIDNNWSEGASTAIKPLSNDNDFNLDTVYQVTESLQDHLFWQLNLITLSYRDKAVAEAFIDAINDNGFLSNDLQEITVHLKDQNADDPLQDDELVAVLKRLQQFDPPGIFARDLKECLSIQLNQLSDDTPYLQEAKVLVENFLEEIATTELAKLVKKSKLDQDSLQQGLELIRTLNPRPGEMLAADDTEYIVPDVYIEKLSGRWQVRLNSTNIPRIRINQTYSDLIKRADDSDENQFLKKNLNEARWFIRSLESRNDTLMQVTMAIVDFQQGFLEHGPVAMKPLVLSEIAEQLELHESTVSRVTTKKYMATPQGIYELKYFFSSHVGTSDGGECSSTAVCAILKMLIEAERPCKPLSDNKLTTLLADQGIQVARRTVAKYRESMNIPSSSQRKRFVNKM
ncbi:MAG: RNA polymerase factor sigma-54 [Porticoccaceae bacterium]|nr:RNA polymerase factor sigma-54 [Porticoccaceae bacterium]